MKTSIFDMTFTLPPMMEMVEVERDIPTVVITVVNHVPYYCP